MATGGVLGNGVKVGFSAASPVSWTAVGQVMNVDMPTLEADDVDTTVHSTSRFKRSMAGMIEVSELTLELLADTNPSTSSAQDLLWNYNQSGTTLYWRVEVPTDRNLSQYTPFEFQGVVKSWKLDAPIDDKQTLTVVVKFDGTTYGKLAPGASAIS